MKKQVEYITLVRDVEYLNPTFDKGVIAICYPGRNRNYTDLPKYGIEKAIKSIYNIPIVARYKIEEDDFSGHDIQILPPREEDGEPEIAWATTPFGVIPESSQQWWETIVDGNGNSREYLMSTCLIWKRQLGYELLPSKEKWGISMEISFDNGYVVDPDGFSVIDDFYFTAICILSDSVEPCFEDAHISVGNIKDNIDFMLKDYDEVKETLPLNEEGGRSMQEEKDIIEEVIEEIETETLEENVDYQQIIDSLRQEIAELKAFKEKKEEEEFNAEVAEVFSRFGDLAEVEEFKSLQNDYSSLDVATIEEKCFAMRGRRVQVEKGTDLQFSIPSNPLVEGELDSEDFLAQRYSK